MTYQYKKLLTAFALVMGSAVSKAQIKPTTATAPQLPLPAVPAAYNPALLVNYVRTWEARKAVSDVSAAGLANNDNYKTATAYFDGLGRPLQTVVKGNNYDGTMDIVSMNVYDQYGREVQQYLPYAPATGSNGKFRQAAFAEQQAYYNANYQDQTPFSKTDYEPSPLNRALKSYAPGNSWAGNNIGVTLQNRVNTIDDDVKKISIANTPGAMPVFGAAYPTGTLYKTISTDEQGNLAVEYKDKGAKVILKKVQEAAAPGASYTGWLCTYYVYDDFDRLAMAIQPKAVKELTGNGWQLAAGVSDELCFKYEYDSENRMVLKKVPGAAPVYMCYDKRDRLVYMQDGNMRGAGNWMVSFYDELNRPSSTALYATTQTQAQLQANLDAITTTNPVPVIAESNLTRLSYAYYDEYTMPGTAAYNSSYVSTAQANISAGDEATDVQPKTNITRGMVTGSKTRILNTTGFIDATIYYDNKGRALQTHSTNHKGGTDVSTVVYSFTGKPLSAVTTHSNPATVIPTPGGITVCTRSTYNNDYLLKTEKKINDGNWKRINQVEYDAMGKPVKKWMGDPANNFYVTNDYNIRGWLTGINKADHAALEANPGTGFYNAIFSEVLSYDYGFTQNQLSGNIAGIKWAAAGDKQARAYGYDYDKLSRLLLADFTQKQSTAWDVSAGINYSIKMGDGINSSSAYDENGNIKRMQQWGFKVGGSLQIDDLAYTYGTPTNPLTNKLYKVAEIATGGTPAGSTATGGLGDFKDGTNTGDDYTYDINGNMVADQNKKISGIVYNHLNLPQHVTVTAQGSIEYVYDAAGNKLQKIVHETGKPDKTTDYISGFVYEDGVLQFTSHEEGRNRYAKQYYLNGDSAYTWQWDYFYKDHLGNIRAVVTEQTDTAKYMATFETAVRAKETALFSNINETAFAINHINKAGLGEACLDCIVPLEGTNYPADPTTVPNEYTSRLNGEGKRIGAAITLKVMAGDKVDLGTKVWYPESGIAGNWDNGNPEEVLTSLLNTLSGSAAGLSGNKATVAELSAAGGPVMSGIENFLNNHPEDPEDETQPRAYLNWMLLDELFNYIPAGSGFIKVPGFDDAIQTLAQQNIPIVKSGYLFVYLSNETRKRDVFFDNLVVQHYTGPLLEENVYYPFGLKAVGISSNAAGRLENKKKYNGYEENKTFDLNWYETFYRTHDPQLGRFWQIDPRPTDFESVYAAMGNNPVKHFDILGDSVGPYPTPDGKRSMNLESTEVEVFDGTVQKLIGSKVTVQPVANSPRVIKSFGLRFDATFGSETGTFKGYFNDIDPSLSFDGYIKQLRNDAEAAFAFDKDGLWDWSIGPGEAKQRTLALGLNFSLPNFFKAGTGAANGGKAAEAAKGTGLADDVAKTFRSGRYTEVILDQSMTLSRYYDNVNAFAKGRFMTNSTSSFKFFDRMSMAIRPSWNNMTKVAHWEIPAGSTIYQGKSAMQFPWIGGKTQYFVPDLGNIKRVISQL